MKTYYATFTAGPHVNHILPIDAVNQEAAKRTADDYGAVWFLTENESEVEYHKAIYGKSLLEKVVSPEMNIYYVTFGIGDVRRDLVQPIFAPSEPAARATAFTHFDDRWAFIYSKEKGEEEARKYGKSFREPLVWQQAHSDWFYADEEDGQA